MKKISAATRLPLAMTMAAALTLSACSSQEEPVPAASAAVQKEEKPFEIKMAFPIFGAEPKDMKLVQEELSKVTKAKINATVTLMPISIGNWTQQMNLMLSGNEKLDLTVVMGYSNAVAKGQLLDMTDLLAKHGSGITSALDKSYIDAAKINGKIYGVANPRDLAVNYGVLFRKDLVDKHQINVGAIKTLNDLEPVLKLIKDKEPGVTPYAPGAVGSTFIEQFPLGDPLGDGFGILPNYDNGLKVVNQYEMPEYAELVKTFHRWYKEGYILKDTATSQTQTSDLMKANKLFANSAQMKPGFEKQEERISGKEYVTAELKSATSTTSNVTSILWAIPKNAQNPERSMQFLNLMFTDPQIVNLLDYGIEGKHYVKVAGSENMIEYPAGLNPTNHPYITNLNWLMGNQFLSYVFKGDDPDIWKKMDAFNKGAAKSKALGFTWDAEPVKTEITAVTNVMNQYKRGLETGILDPEKNLTLFISKLREAGIDKIIAEKQKQLDVWAKSQQK